MTWSAGEGALARPACLLPLALALACSGRAATRAPDDASLRERSRVWIERSEPTASGWLLVYRNRTQTPLRCQANLRWVEEHPPQAYIGETADEFELPAGALVEVGYPMAESPKSLAESLEPDAAEPERRRPARAEYATVEVEREGLYLICEPSSAE